MMGSSMLLAASRQVCNRGSCSGTWLNSHASLMRSAETMVGSSHKLVTFNPSDPLFSAPFLFVVVPNELLHQDPRKHCHL